jgi:Icc-related predicted phosphoesterase
VPRCFFATDLHGREARYESLFGAIAGERPDAVFLGGDLLPHGYLRRRKGRPVDLLVSSFRDLRRELGEAYPQVFLILGNDDPRVEEGMVIAAAREGVWHYVHERRVRWGDHTVLGYACVPPTPFQMKDWERYDVSRYVDPGCVSPEEGWRSVEVPGNRIRYGTIAEDLEKLAGREDLARAIFLCHTPPYATELDRAALDGKMIDHVPLDVHVGSIAVKRFIEARQPLLSLHGHIHESTRLTGEWRDRIGRTHMFNAAHHGPELALVAFDTARLEDAERRLL